ncbi:MAG: DUF6920 family protein [Gemmatirosa sp.]
MRDRLKTRTVVLSGIATVTAVAAAALVAAGRRWDDETTRAVARLHDASSDASDDGVPADVYAPARLDAAPAPVRRYLAFALTPGQRPVRRARVEHAGAFAAEPGQWRPFRSVQHFTADPPGFVWDARLSMAPSPFDALATVRVRDGYLAGVGSMRAAVAALVLVAAQEGTREIASSALWRYLAEAVWFPTALLPSDRLTWTAVDDRTARATLRDRGAVAVADFHFGHDGEVVRVTGVRYRAVGDAQVATPTEGRHRAYARIGGMMVPTEGEVAWLLPEGPHAYWRGRLRHAVYEVRDP